MGVLVQINKVLKVVAMSLAASGANLTVAARLYLIDFEPPADTIGLPPAVGAGNGALSSIILGDPLVVPETARLRWLAWGC